MIPGSKPSQGLLPSLVHAFHPDLIVSQHGCDTHTWDPLTHFSLTTRSAAAQAKLTHDLAHEHCQGRWVALGGGGYDIYRVVPRAWALVWSEFREGALPEEIPAAWLDRWQPECPDALPLRFWTIPRISRETTPGGDRAAQSPRRGPGAAAFPASAGAPGVSTWSPHVPAFPAVRLGQRRGCARLFAPGGQGG